MCSSYLKANITHRLVFAAGQNQGLKVKGLSKRIKRNKRRGRGKERESYGGFITYMKTYI